MEHMTEILIIMTNAALLLSNIVLAIVTGMDNHAMAKIATMAIAKIAPNRVVKQAYVGLHRH